jgi:hypothetical protein
MPFTPPEGHPPSAHQAPPAQPPTIDALVAAFLKGSETQRQSQEKLDATTTKEFGGREKARMLGWMGLDDGEEEAIPPFWGKYLAESTAQGRRAALKKALEQEADRYECVHIHVSAQLNEDVHKRYFGDTGMLAWMDCHRGIAPLAAALVTPQEEAARDKEEDDYSAATLITPEDRKKSRRSPPPCPTNYHDLMDLLRNYIVLLRTLFGGRCDHLHGVRRIRATLIEQHRRMRMSVTRHVAAQIVWAITVDARQFFGHIVDTDDLVDGIRPKSTLDAIHSLIVTNQALSIQDVPKQWLPGPAAGGDKKRMREEDTTIKCTSDGSSNPDKGTDTGNGRSKRTLGATVQNTKWHPAFHGPIKELRSQLTGGKTLSLLRLARDSGLKGIEDLHQEGLGGAADSICYRWVALGDCHSKCPRAATHEGTVPDEVAKTIVDMLCPGIAKAAELGNKQPMKRGRGDS